MIQASPIHPHLLTKTLLSAVLSHNSEKKKEWRKDAVHLLTAEVCRALPHLFCRRDPVHCLSSPGCRDCTSLMPTLMLLLNPASVCIHSAPSTWNGIHCDVKTTQPVLHYCPGYEGKTGERLNLKTFVIINGTLSLTPQNPPSRFTTLILLLLPLSEAVWSPLL